MVLPLPAGEGRGEGERSQSSPRVQKHREHCLPAPLIASARKPRLASFATACLLFPLVLLSTITPAFAQDQVTTLAGSPLANGAADGSTILARFSDPAAIGVDARGNIFIADNANHTIRKLTPDGTVSTFAGRAGVPGSADGAGAAARFDSPSGLAIDRAGNVFVSDTGNHTLRKISPSGQVTTVAGTAGESAALDGSGPAARFNSPLGLAVDSSGVVFVADSGNHLIRRVASDGTVSTFAGRAENFGSTDGAGTNAAFNNPVGLALDASGNLFVADANNHCVRKISSTGVVTTFAGTPDADGCVDGAGANARFSKPAELAFDPRGNLYVADAFNHTLRKVSPAGIVISVSGVAGADGAGDGANRSARFYNPYGVAFDLRGHLLVSDTYNQTLRRVLVPFTVTLNAAPAGGSLISWDAVAGRRYQVQFKDTATAARWQNLGGVLTAEGQTASQPDPAPAPSRCYRIQLAEP